MCNGDSDCADNSDENNCTKYKRPCEEQYKVLSNVDVLGVG